MTLNLETFEAERPRLLGLAYRITGSRHDADDVVQEAWIRFERETQDLKTPEAWLTTVVSRLAIDRARVLKRERKHYVGPWLPEPTSLDLSPEELAVRADSLTLAFLIVLDQLSPPARAAFILVDVFGESYSSVATHLGRSEASCRQLVHRARAAVRGSDVSSLRPMDSGLLEQLISALVSGDDDQLITLLSPDVVLTSDGGLHRRAARRPVLGRARVVRFLTNLSRREPEASALVGSVNFGACLYIESTKGPLLLAGSVRGSTIAHINLVMNPDKLQGADQPRLIA